MLTLLAVLAVVPLSLAADTSEAATYLMCDPVERLVEVQVCDYSNSPYGGICVYSLRERPFRTNSTNIWSLSNVSVTSLPSDKETELRTFLGSRLIKVEHRPPFEYALQSISQLVPPYQRITVRQKMILCGPYSVPTPEIVPTFEVPIVDRWMLHRPSKKLFYISSEKVTRSVADRKCKAMAGSLAVLDDSSQYSFVARIFMLREPRSITNDGVWTAATNFVSSEFRYLQWKEGKPRRNVITSPSLGYPSCVLTLFELRLFRAVDCSDSLFYVCEKDSNAT